MKATFGKHFVSGIAVVLCLLLGGAAIPALGQSAPPSYNFDTDIMAIRDEAVPTFRWHYDDYLQYAPAGVMLGLKAFGCEGRSSWGRMLVSDAFSAATMAIAVNGLKYSIGRIRPDGSKRNSFPSGHTATAFMTATMLHMEYGWKSPWYSIGGFSAAAITGVSRLLNNRHWMSDVVAGAAIGIGSVHLGYFITDKIFKKKGLNEAYCDPEFHYDPTVRHYVAELLFGRRFIIGAEGRKEMGEIPFRGGIAGVQTDIALAPGLGLTARASASSMTFKDASVENLYSTLAGGFYNVPFARILEFQTRVMIGAAWFQGECGTDLSAGVGLSLITDRHFKIKAFADFESIDTASQKPWLNSAIVGYSASWFW